MTKKVNRAHRHSFFGKTRPKHIPFSVIDIHDVLNQRLNIDFRRYKILGAFNSEFAYKVITLESHLGLIIPCHLVVQQHENGDVEVSAISPPEAAEGSLSTPLLTELSTQVDNHLRRAVDDLHRQTGEHQHPEALPMKARRNEHSRSSPRGKSLSKKI